MHIAQLLLLQGHRRPKTQIHLLQGNCATADSTPNAASSNNPFEALSTEYVDRASNLGDDAEFDIYFLDEATEYFNSCSKSSSSLFQIIHSLLPSNVFSRALLQQSPFSTISSMNVVSMLVPQIICYPITTCSCNTNDVGTDMLFLAIDLSSD